MMTGKPLIIQPQTEASIESAPRRLAQRPGGYAVLVYRRPVIKRKSEQSITTSPAPAAVPEGCYCDVSLLAGLMVDKAIYHLPLYRQHQRMLGVPAMDEVPIKAGKAGKGKMKQTCFRPIYGEEDEVAFTWSSSRSAAHAIEQLTGFNGTLLTDGYPAYTKAVDTLRETTASFT